MPLPTRSLASFFRQVPPRLGRVAPLLALWVALFAPFVAGAVEAPWLAGCALVAASALAAHGAERLLHRRPTQTSWLLLPWLIAAGWTAFSLLPLPAALRALVAPAHHERVGWVTALLGDEARALVRPVWHLDPPEGAMGLLRLSGALCIFLVISGRARHRDVRHRLYRAVLVGAFLLFLAALGHRLAGATHIWGWVKAGGTPFFAPLVNPNHLARAFGALSLLCIGRAFLVRSRTESFWFVMVGVLCGAGVLLTLSRGGILVYLATLVALGAGFFAARAHEEEEVRGEGRGLQSPGRAVAIQLSGILVLCVGLYTAHEAILRELGTLGDEELETSKAFLYPLSLRLLAPFGALGVGAGAFGAAFPSGVEVGELPVFGTFSHAENIVVQTLVDYGYAVGGGLLLLALVLLAGLLAHARRASLLGPLAATLFLLGGDLFDFSLELGFGSFLLAACLGLACAELPAGSRLEIPLRLRTLGVVGAGVAAALALALPAALADNRRDTDRGIASAPRRERYSALERALARHPTDAQYAYELATEARARKDAGQALAWANRALMLWPSHAGAHLEAARALAARGYLEQALLEYQLSWRSHPGSAGSVLAEVAKRTPDVAARLLALPPDHPGARARLCELLWQERRPEETQACWTAVLDMEAGANLGHRKRALQIALSRKDAAQARALLDAYGAERAIDAEWLPLQADLRALESSLEAALEESAAWLVRAQQPQPLLRWRLSAASRLRRPVEAYEALARLRPLASGPRDVDQLDRIEASLRRGQGELGDALSLWRRIVRRTPRDVGALVQQGQLELTLGFLEQASETVARAQRIDAERRDVVALASQVEEARQRADEARVRKLLTE